MAIIKDGNVLGKNTATVASGKSLTGIYAAYPNKYYYGGTSLTVYGKMDSAELTDLKTIFTTDTAALDALYLASQNSIRQFNSIQLLSGVSVNNIVTDLSQTVDDTDLATALAVKNCMFRENAQTIDSDYTVLGTVNASTVGPITIASGVTITIETGGVWTII